MTQGYNPYLPGWEYLPDGEPHVFGDRVYVYGSHDKFGGPLFCMNDYICWSANVHNLKEWHYEGVIYRKNQDPINKSGKRCMYAPDVCRGHDGRYYLYYALDFRGIMSVAVCDEPAGEYQFYGHIRFHDGHIWGTKAGEPFPFDPGVLVDDDGRVYLYSGFAIKVPMVATGFRSLTNEGGVVVELEDDMLTIKSGPELLFPTKGKKGAFENHAFFEASSIRKIDEKYYFIYSSQHNHELCYAVSQTPKGPFSFGGTLVDIGDVFLNGNTDEKTSVNYLGNTHGSLEKIDGEWYVFYHRHTNRHSYSRQACAERIQRTKSGKFLQAEVTSCGLNNGPLKGTGKYPARIACNLLGKEGTARYDIRFPRLRLRKHPYFTQDNKDEEMKESQYIANIRDGSVAGFKYFLLQGLEEISIEIRGNAKGKIIISDSIDFQHVYGTCPVRVNSYTWEKFKTSSLIPDGISALYFKFEGKGKLQFSSFELHTKENI